MNMEKNILRANDVTSIYLCYIEDFQKRKLSVKIRFLDTKECYLATDDIPVNYNKPKRKLPAQIVAYTEDGIYRADVKIIDANISGTGVMYITERPSKWEYKQLRSGTRKKVEIPFCIKFSDGYEINAKTYDIAIGGLSFYPEQPIPDLYQKFSGTLSMEIPDNSNMNINSININVETKFVREHKDKNNPLDKRLVFKFIGLNQQDTISLKTYLINLL